MRIDDKKRYEIFEEYMNLKSQVQELASIVQNDFEIKIKDLEEHKTQTEDIGNKLKVLYRSILDSVE